MSAVTPPNSTECAQVFLLVVSVLLVIIFALTWVMRRKP